MSSKQKLPAKTFDSAIAYFRSHSFDVQETPGVANQIQIGKHGCGAVLACMKTGGVAYIAGPGCMIGGEIATLVDRGYQKFLTTSQIQIAATADRLRALHDFQEEVNEAAGTPDFYNLSLGTVSDSYLYDRVQGRDPLATVTENSH